MIETLQRLAWVSAAGFSKMARLSLADVHASFDKVFYVFV